MVYESREKASAGSISGRAPRRISTTLPPLTYDQLERRSLREGRSISNLAAYLIERGLKPVDTTPH